jgi:choline dehydrogenase
VRLADNDPHSRPVIDHRYGSDPEGHDLAVLGDGLELLRTMTTDPALAAILGAPGAGNDHAMERLVNYCHPAGSCAMGPSTDPGAVVDSGGAVHGVGNLYISDASIMPSITRGNPNLPVAMIGARVAAGLLRREPTDVIYTHR